MKSLPLTVVIVAGVAAIVLIERPHIDTQPSPQALLTAAADVQHEVTRIPAGFVKLSDQNEIELGKQMAAHVYLQPRLSSAEAEQNQRIEAYLQQVGDKTAAHARRKLPWIFHYIPDRNFVNAFALPGGQIFVGQGLLLQMHSEDALSAVLGHEIEHVDLRHCAERAQTEAELRQLGAVGMLASLPIDVFVAGYSKEQESEADRDGITLAVEAGYSYTGLVELLSSVEKQHANSRTSVRPNSPISESVQLSSATLTGYFATHLPNTQRVDQIQRDAHSFRWKARPFKVLDVSFDWREHARSGTAVAP